MITLKLSDHHWSIWCREGGGECFFKVAQIFISAHCLDRFTIKWMKECSINIKISHWKVEKWYMVMRIWKKNSWDVGTIGFNFPHKSFNYMLCLFLQLVAPLLKNFFSGQGGGCTQVIQQKPGARLGGGGELVWDGTKLWTPLSSLFMLTDFWS